MIVTRGLGRNGTAKTTLALGGYGRYAVGESTPGWISATLTGTGTLVAGLRFVVRGDLAGTPTQVRRFWRRI